MPSTSMKESTWPSVGVPSPPASHEMPNDAAVGPLWPGKAADGSSSPHDSGAPDAESAALGSAPASIVSSIPADGARGVLPDVELVIDFGRPMNIATVPGAIVSNDIPLEGAVFVWNADESSVRIALADPLTLASGDDPEQVRARCHAYRVSDAALDAAGQPIVPSSIAFCSARQISQTLAPILDADSTGGLRSDGSAGDGACAPRAGAICVGDSGFAANTEYRGFLTFDSSALAPPMVVLSAELVVGAGSITGTPFEDLGSLLVEQTSFATIDAAAFDTTGLIVVGALRPTSAAALSLSGDVAPALRELRPGRLQLRLRFERATDQDGTSDHILARSRELGMRVDYLIP